MKNILIPTDFSSRSFKLIDCLTAEKQLSSAKIVFVHGFKLSGDLGDMLMLGRRSKDLQNINEDFYNLINQYKEKYHKAIAEISIEYFYGNTTVAFRNFLDGQNIDLIAYDHSLDFEPLNKYSINPKTLFERANCDLLNLNVGTLKEIELDAEEKTAAFAQNAYVFV